MPRQKPFSKKTSTTYALVHRPQNDPRINDSEASSHVFAQISGRTVPSTAPSTSTARKSNSKIKQRGDLEDEFGIAFNPNEGEAAEHGIYYDDTSYDYMQHMRDLGGSGVGSSADAQATWLEAPTRQGDRKRGEKKQQSLEDALRSASLSDDEDDLQSTSGMSYATTSKSTIQRPKYEAQQDIPDSIAGFQPNMDPRLREVLEALEDEAYVEEEDDFFNDLSREGGDEIEQDEFEDQLYDDFEGDEDGWESDATEKPTKEYTDIPPPPSQPTNDAQLPPPSSTNALINQQQQQQEIPDSTTDGDWLASFAKSKATTLAPSTLHRATPSITASQNTTASTQRKKKRKGALTNASGYSMTSSALARTEAMSVLDERFERLADMYMNDIPEDDEEFDDTASAMTGMSRATAKTNATWKTNRSAVSHGGGGSTWGGSQAPSLVSASGSARPLDTETMTSNTFDSMMDEFLGGVGGHGRGIRMKRSGGSKEATWGKQTPMEQLDEVRNGLGGARLSEKWRVGREGKIAINR